MNLRYKQNSSNHKIFLNFWKKVGITCYNVYNIRKGQRKMHRRPDAKLA